MIMTVTMHMIVTVKCDYLLLLQLTVTIAIIMICDYEVLHD